MVSGRTSVLPIAKSVAPLHVLKVYGVGSLLGAHQDFSTGVHWGKSSTVFSPSLRHGINNP